METQGECLGSLCCWQRMGCRGDEGGGGEELKDVSVLVCVRGEWGGGRPGRGAWV